LKSIEESENAKDKPLQPLTPMMDQLEGYLNKTDSEPILDGSEVITKLGGLKSQFYRAYYAIAKVMLVEGNENHRGIIFYNKPRSGKTRIAEYMQNIFDCHWK